MTSPATQAPERTRSSVPVTLALPGGLRGRSRLVDPSARPELPAWPVLAVIWCFPLWWASGTVPFIPVIFGTIMAVYLLARRPLRIGIIPALFACFMAWAAASALELDEFDRLLGFGMRYANFILAFLTLIYVLNARHSLPLHRITAALAVMWGIVVVGGVASTFIPDVRLTTPMALILPHSLTDNALVHEWVYPPMAEVQQPWGAPQPFNRPAAPFPYVNSWGNAFAVLTPAVIAHWTATKRRWTRLAIIGGFLLALIPIYQSTNRGMMIGLATGLIYVAIRAAFSGRTKLAAALIGTMVSAVAAMWLSGAIAWMLERLSYSESTSDRETLYAETWHKTLKSPFLGWGGPRPSDYVPVSVGTQGYVWTLMFSFGLVGMALFFLFLYSTIFATWRVPDVTSLWLHAVVVVVAVMVLIYGYDSVPMLSVLMMAAGVLLRERRTPVPGESQPRAGIPAGPRHYRLRLRLDDAGWRALRRSWATRPGEPVGSSVAAHTDGLDQSNATADQAWAQAALAANAPPLAPPAGAPAPSAARPDLAARTSSAPEPRRATSKPVAAPPGPVGGSVAGSSLIAIVGAGFGAIVGYIVTAVITNGLGTEGAGQVMAVIAAFTIMCNILELGADTGLVRFMSREKALGRTGAFTPTLRSAIVPVLAIGLPIVAVAAISWPMLRPVAPFILCASLLQVVLGGTRGLGSIVPYALVDNVGMPLLRLSLVAGAIACGLGPNGTLTGWALPYLVLLAPAGVILARSVRRYGGPAQERLELTENERRETSRAFWRFSRSRGFAAAVEIILEWSDVLLLAVFASKSQAAIYAVVTRCVRAGQIVDQGVRVAVSPVISAALALDDKASAARTYINVSKIMILLQWPFYLLLATFGPVVLSIFGTGFDTGAPAMALMGLTMMTAGVAGTLQTVLLMGGKSSWQLTNKSIVLVFSLATNLILIPRWGFMGAALTWSVAQLLDIALAAWRVYGTMRLRPAFSQLITPGLLAIGVFGVGGMVARSLVGGVLLASLGAIAGLLIVYVVLLLALRHRLGLDLPARRMLARLRPGGGGTSRGAAASAVKVGSQGGKGQ